MLLIVGMKVQKNEKNFYFNNGTITSVLIIQSKLYSSYEHAKHAAGFKFLSREIVLTRPVLQCMK